ncbi:MAG: hypothetical protein RR334_00105 [Clostridia bacterium]
MSKTFKIIISVIVVIIVGALGAVGVFALLNKQEVGGITSIKMMYTTGESQKEVYLSKASQNKEEINVEFEVTNAPRYLITSSNSNVAELKEENGKFVIYYKNVGNAVLSIISTTNSAIYDNVSVTIKQNAVYSLKIKYDKESSEITKSNLAYCDDNIPYYINYELFDSTGKKVDSSYIDMSYGDESTHLYIETANIDCENNRAVFVCNTGERAKEGVVPVNFSTYIYDNNGNKIITNTYSTNLNIVKNKIEELRVELFEDNNFPTEANNLIGHDYLPASNEKIYLASKISGMPSFIYLRLKTVDTNGSERYLQENTIITSTEDSSIVKYGTYYKITFTETMPTSFTFEYTDGVKRSATINITKISTYDASKFYEYNETNKTFKYKYFDERFRSKIEETNADGNIIRISEHG